MPSKSATFSKKQWGRPPASGDIAEGDAIREEEDASIRMIESRPEEKQKEEEKDEKKRK